MANERNMLCLFYSPSSEVAENRGGGGGGGAPPPPPRPPAPLPRPHRLCASCLELVLLSQILSIGTRNSPLLVAGAVPVLLAWKYSWPMNATCVARSSLIASMDGLGPRGDSIVPHALLVAPLQALLIASMEAATSSSDSDSDSDSDSRSLP